MLKPLRAPRQLSAIGKYVVLELLSDKGGQAEVYRALHPTLRKELVIKLSRRPLRDGQESHDRLVAEGKLLAELEHPHLARVYDLDFHDQRAFLAMEYVRGVSLSDHSRSGHVSPRDAAVLVAKTARALAVPHARGLIHQDIKPGNILIDEAGEPRLIDFGMARLRQVWTEDATEPGSISGTPAFMAPEQARGETDRVNQRSDVFGLGAVLYHLLVGRAPFAAATVRESIDRASRCDCERSALAAPGIPRRFARICLWAMAADPEARPATALELAEALERAVGRPRQMAWLVAAAALLLVGVTASRFWHKRGESSENLPNPSTATSGTAEGRLSVRVWQGDEEKDLASALPLRSGDDVQIRAELPEGFRAALFWFDSEGNLTDPLPFETIGSGSTIQLVFPMRGKSRELLGRAGTEVLLLCVSRSRQPEPTDVQALLDVGRPWPELPPGSWLSIDRNQVQLHGTRGVGSTDRDRPGRDVLDRAEALRRKLAGSFDLVQGIAFPHQE